MISYFLLSLLWDDQPTLDYTGDRLAVVRHIQPPPIPAGIEYRIR